MLNGDLNKIKLEKAADYIGTYYMWNGILMRNTTCVEPLPSPNRGLRQAGRGPQAGAGRARRLTRS